MFKPLKLPIANAHYKGPLTEKVSVNAPLPLDLLWPASSSSLLQDINEPLTLRMDVDSRVDSLPSIFNVVADTHSSSLAGYNTFKGEFKHYHNQVMASRDPKYDFSILDNSTV
jgi:hypothetical protein